MKIDKTKYQTIIFVISLLYVNFFVFSPFFHHHHPEKELTHIQSAIVYSPITNDCCEVDCDESNERHLEDCSDNSHNLEDCYVNSGFITRNFKPNLKVDTDSNLNYIINDDDKAEFEKPIQEDFFLLQWEKLVHSAANVSPPTA